MKNRVKKIGMFIIIISMICMPFNIYAVEDNGQDTTEAIDYAKLFQNVMELVVQVGLDDMNEQEVYEAAMYGLFNAMDPYSKFMTIEQTNNFTNSFDPSFVGIGVELKTIGQEHTIMKVFDDSPAYYGGVKKGDVFKAVDGEDVTNLVMDELLELLLGKEDTSVTITFDRGGTEYSVNLIRSKVIIPTVYQQNIEELYKDLDEEIAHEIEYLQITSFGENTDEDFNLAIERAKEKDVKYLILDLRNNLGGYTIPAINICKEIIPEGEIISFINKYGQGTTYSSDLDKAPFEIIALVNENSASSTEIVASAIQDSHVGVLVGETTYGKGVSQNLFQLTDEYVIKITSQEFFSRNGNKIHEVGITPDYEVDVPDFIVSDKRLYVNDNLNEVLMAEKILDFLGYDVGEPDTVYDSLTYQAVKQFQGDTGLGVYGVCDYTTQAKLNEELTKTLMAKDIQLNKAVKLIAEKYHD